MSDIDTYDTQIAILNQVAEEMHKKGATHRYTCYTCYTCYSRYI